MHTLHADRHLLVSLACLLAGCGSSSADSGTSQARQSIVNGAADADFAQVVGLGDENGSVPAGFCSATLITPRILLSAAHCGDTMPTDYVRTDLRAFFGPTITSYELAAGLDDWHIHPLYEPSAPAGEGMPYDLSVLILSEPVSFAPAHVRLTPLQQAEVAGEATSVGYGCTSWGGGEFGDRHRAAVTVDTLTELFLYSLTETNPNEANICSGDSGGGMFLGTGADATLIGVHSEGVAFIGGAPLLTVADRVDAVATWLRDEVEAVHGDRDLCQINQQYGDGTCDDGCLTDDPDCATEVDAGAGGAGGGGGGGSAGQPPTPPRSDVPRAEPEGCQLAAPNTSAGTSLWLVLGAWFGHAFRRRHGSTGVRAGRAGRGEQPDRDLGGDGGTAGGCDARPAGVMPGPRV